MAERVTSPLNAAVAALYRAPHEAFVSERKRLAAELKTAGDKAAAAELMKRTRPTLSAWAVNQLWWHAQPEFEALFEAAERLRQGERDATRAHRDAIAELRARASELLADAGHAVNDAVLRRVASTLSALAANGSFEPDLPGALSADRDPPGFGALGLAAALSAGAAAPAPDDDAEEPAPDQSADQRRALEAVAERQRLEQEQRRAEAERARLAEQKKLEDELRAAKTEIETRRLELVRTRDALAAAERKLEQAHAVAAALETRLAALAARE